MAKHIIYPRNLKGFSQKNVYCPSKFSFRFFLFAPRFIIIYNLCFYIMNLENDLYMILLSLDILDQIYYPLKMVGYAKC